MAVLLFVFNQGIDKRGGAAVITVLHIAGEVKYILRVGVFEHIFLTRLGFYDNARMVFRH